MQIAVLQLILIYPGQQRGSCALHLPEGRRASEPATGQR